MSDRSKRRIDLSITAVFVAALLLVGAVLIFSGGTATAKQIATLRIFQGQVDVQHGEDAFAPGENGDSLREGDTVRTGPDGRAAIEYFDGSVTRLDFDSTFSIVRLETLDNDAGSKVIEAEQTGGNSFNRVAELTDAESRFEVETPTATASVQGTVYALLFNPTRVVVIDGSVIVQTDAGEVDRAGPLAPPVGNGDEQLTRPAGADLVAELEQAPGNCDRRVACPAAAVDDDLGGAVGAAAGTVGSSSSSPRLRSEGAGPPVLGHCLGGQLMAKALGSTVNKNPVVEIGWHNVKKVNTPAADAWLHNLPEEFIMFHWHNERFDLPEGATRILYNAHCDNQAYVYNNIHLGLQRHPEMTTTLVRGWMEGWAQNIPNATDSIQNAVGNIKL